MSSPRPSARAGTAARRSLCRSCGSTPPAPDACGALSAAGERVGKEAKILREIPSPAGGHFFGPVLAEIPSAAFLQREVFGPILHVVRYDANDLAAAAAPLAAAGYGLTLRAHSRIEAFADQVRSLVPAGNAYVNRSIIGA